MSAPKPDIGYIPPLDLGETQRSPQKKQIRMASIKPSSFLPLRIFRLLPPDTPEDDDPKPKLLTRPLRQSR